MPSAIAMWDQKVTLLPNPTAAGAYIAFTRAYIHRAPDVFSVAMLASSDGLDLTEVGILWQPQTGHTFYDPHVSIDNSVCPPRYVMSTECVGASGWASLCLSSSSSPHLPETWHYPAIFVNAVTSPARESASTGVSLTDGSQRYVAWTQVSCSAMQCSVRRTPLHNRNAFAQVYDGTEDDDPTSHTFSQSAAVKSFYGSSYFGTVVSPGVTTMQAQPFLHCFCISRPRPTPPHTSGWLQSQSLSAVTCGTAITGAFCPSRSPRPSFFGDE
jgi:hypothetical protein